MTAVTAGQRLRLAGIHSAAEPAPSSMSCLQAADEGVEAGGEPLVAVVGPGVGTEDGQCGEPAGGQGAQEVVQFASGGGVLDALLAGVRWGR